MLTDNEKAAIIKSHIRNIESNKYNAQLSIIEENSLTSPNEDTLIAAQARVASFQSQIDSLTTELDKLIITDSESTPPGPSAPIQ